MRHRRGEVDRLFGVGDRCGVEHEQRPHRSEGADCALQATDGRNAVAQFDTPLGKFGIQSRIAIIDKDPVNLHVMGQRIGSLVAFGQEFPTELQFFDFASPTEYQNAQSVIYKRRDAYPLPPKTYWQSIPAHRGQYSLFTTGGHHFDINAEAEIPVGGIFNVRLSFDFVNRMPYDGHNAFAYAMTRPATASDIEEGSEDARRVSFATMQAECKACRQSIPRAESTRAVRRSAQTTRSWKITSGRAAPQGFGACTDAYYSDLGTVACRTKETMALRPFVDMGSPNNWWHIGAPKNSQLVATLPGEPVYSLLSGGPELSDPTTHLGFGIGVNASVKIFKIDVGLNATSTSEMASPFAKVRRSNLIAHQP